MTAGQFGQPYHDWPGNPRPPFFLVSFAGAALVVALVCIVTALSGCSSIDKLPAGTQVQSSTFGLKVAPQAPDGTPLTLGSHSLIITTAQPNDAGPNLNRFEGRAPGIQLRSTVATGPVGEQLQKAGGPEALRELMQDRTGRERPIPITEPVP